MQSSQALVNHSRILKTRSAPSFTYWCKTTVLNQFAMTPGHRVLRTLPMLLLAGRICYGEIVIAINPVKRLVIAVWITTSGEFVDLIPSPLKKRFSIPAN